MNSLRLAFGIAALCFVFSAKSARADDNDKLMELLRSPSMAVLGLACERITASDYVAPAHLAASNALTALQDYCKGPTDTTLVALAGRTEMERLVAVCATTKKCNPYAGSTAIAAFNGGVAASTSAAPVAPLQFPSISIAGALTGGLRDFLEATAREKLKSFAIAQARELREDACRKPILVSTCSALANSAVSFSSLREAIVKDLVELPARVVEQKLLDHVDDNSIKFSFAFVGALVAHGDLFESLRIAAGDTAEFQQIATLLGGIASFVEVTEGNESAIADATAAMIIQHVYSQQQYPKINHKLVFSVIRRVRSTVQLAARVGAATKDGRLSALLPTFERFLGDVSLASRFFGLDKSIVHPRTFEMILSLSAHDYAKFYFLVADLLEESCAECLNDKSTRLLMLGADMLEAKTAEEASAALIAFTKHEGNSRTRRSTMNINALALANAALTWQRTPMEWDYNSEVGLSAVLGVQFAGPAPWKPRWYLPEWFGLTVSVVDALAPAAVQNEDTTRRGSSLLAPGLFVEVGLTRTLVLAGGITALPFGAEVKTESATRRDLVMRASLSLGFSLPILELTAP